MSSAQHGRKRSLPRHSRRNEINDGMNDVRLLPLRQVASRFDRHEPSPRHCLEQRRAEFEGHGFVLFPPYRQDRSRMLTDPLQLGALIESRIVHGGRQLGASKPAISDLFAVSVRPVRKALRLVKVAQLGISPPALLEDGGQEVPQSRQVVEKRDLMRSSKRRVDVDQSPDAIRIPIRKGRDDSSTERKAGEVDWLRDVQRIEQFRQLPDNGVVRVRDVRTVGVSAAVVVVPQHPESSIGE